MEVLDVALAGCRDNMITDKKIVSEMQYDDLKSELMYYLKCYMNVIEKLSKHVEYTEETLKLLQELCSDVKSFLAKVARLDEKQQKNIPNGTVILSDSKIGLKIKANGGIITVIEIQGENAKRMNVTDYLRGNSILEGAKFD